MIENQLFILPTSIRSDHFFCENNKKQNIIIIKLLLPTIFSVF